MAILDPLRAQPLAVALAWTATVALGLLVPLPAGWSGPDFGGIGFDKLIHFGIFALLVWLWRGWGERRRGWERWGLALLVVAAVVYGGALELLQGPVGRDPSWRDLAADAVGALAALLPPVPGPRPGGF